MPHTHEVLNLNLNPVAGYTEDIHVSLFLQGKCQVSTSNKVTCFEKFKQLQILKETELLLMDVHWAVVNK